MSDYCLVEVCSDVKGREMKEDQCPLKNTTETSPSHVWDVCVCLDICLGVCLCA